MSIDDKPVHGDLFFQKPNEDEQKTPPPGGEKTSSVAKQIISAPAASEAATIPPLSKAGSGAKPEEDLSNLLQKTLKIQEVKSDIEYNQYTPDSDSFGKLYSIKSREGLSAGANGSVEKIIASSDDDVDCVFAIKTCQPMMIFQTEPLHVLGPAIEKGGELDVNTNIGWTKCTGSEKIRIYNLFKQSERVDISTLEELKNTYSEKDIKKFRKEIFGSENGGEKRVPDLHLKMLAAFCSTCIEDLRECGNLGESDICQEAAIYNMLGKTGHPNILRMVSFGKNESQDSNYISGYYIVMEYASGGTFLDQCEKSTPLPFEKLIDYSIQLASSIAFLQSNGIAHRDVKLDNILIGEDGKLKLSDFGTACSIEKPEGTPGNPDAMPPEWSVSALDQSKFDCWALGFALIQLALPKEKWDKIDLLQNILDPVKESYRKSLLLDNPEFKEKDRQRVVTCILEGNNGQKKYDCGLNALFPSAEGSDGMKMYIEIIKKLLEPDPSKRIDGKTACSMLKKLVL